MSRHLGRGGRELREEMMELVRGDWQSQESSTLALRTPSLHIHTLGYTSSPCSRLSTKLKVRSAGVSVSNLGAAPLCLEAKA